MKKGQKRIKKKTSHGLTRNLTEGRTRLSICHGRTRKEEQEWNSAYAKLTIAQGHPSASSGAGIFTVSEPAELAEDD